MQNQSINYQNPSRSGFGLRNEVQENVIADYDSTLINKIKQLGGTYKTGRLTFHLAQEFGFCYGVDHALSLAYETKRQFPSKTIYLTGEIIHNPSVNERLIEMGYKFLTAEHTVTNEDVVLIPAFGTPVDQLRKLQSTGCLLIDTTCGSVVHVWKRVEKYARDGFTAIIHGKYDHEETEATRSQTQLYPNGKFLVVRDKDQAQIICKYILGEVTKDHFLKQFRNVASPEFNPDKDLQKIGLANQTTMLSSESLEIAEMIRLAMEQRYGKQEITERFRSFDTICSATQDRQDAVLQLIKENLDLMLVIGGYNSSNTTHLAEISSCNFPTYHISNPACIVSALLIKHQPIQHTHEIETQNWLPLNNITIGITAGASTPNRVVGDCIEKIIKFSK